MKTLFNLAAIIVCFTLFSSQSFAQQNENRTKIQMTIRFEGKEIVSDLTGVSTSFSRSGELLEPVAATPNDSVETKTLDYYPAAIYLSVDANQVSDDLLRVFGKKNNRFEGKITVVDTYGRTPTRTIEFKYAAVQSFSQQMSTYGESYGNSAMTFICKEISVNGIPMEQ